MSHLRVAKTVFFIALAASRNPMVRHAIGQAPKMIPEQHKKAAFRRGQGCGAQGR